jgi:glutamate/tyrosine decarboxylase-like PLP-dependent enzyme
MAEDARSIAGWFAGPKAENGEWFAEVIRRIVQDYHAWRRNYFPEDGVVVDSSVRRHCEAFRDAFDDRLIELLGRLKGDFPFQSPRYAAHMLAEQTLPAIAGYFAAMLYNPNNVSADAAPVTVRLELEACRLIARMLGHDGPGWAHLTSGGTVANIEALWVARTVRYLPLVVADMRTALGLPADPALPKWLAASPEAALAAFARVFDQHPDAGAVVKAYLGSEHNVVERGVARVLAAVGSSPALLLPETHHYCFEKALDVLGLGRAAIVPIAVDERFRMITADLQRALDALPGRGLHALAVVAVVGSTEEGAVDPVDEIVALRRSREEAGKGSFWLHADAAYGGYLRTMTIPTRLGLGEPWSRVMVGGREHRVPLALPEHHECRALEHLGWCDSITIDPHKLGYIPYPAGAVSFRSDVVKPLTRQEAPYIDEAPADARSEQRSESVGLYILEGSKPGAAAAAVWLSHTLIPLDSTGHGALIRGTVRDACELHALLAGYPDLAGRPSPVRCEPLCAPSSNIVCYAFRPRAGATLADINRLNRSVYERFSVSASERVYDQRFFVSRTTLRAAQYRAGTVRGFLERLGVTRDEYEHEGVFLLRSVLMNPWYALAKERGRWFLAELTQELYRTAEELAI